MQDKRKIEIPFFPYLVLVFGLLMMFAAVLVYFNFPHEGKLAAGILAAGVMVAAFAFLLRPEMIDEFVRNRKTLLWINDLALILIIVSIGVVLSHIGFRRNIRYDFTRDGTFSLSDQTLRVVKGLEKEVKITAFYPKNTREEQMVKDLLEEYRRYSDKLKTEYVDPYRDPMTVKAMNISSPGTIVVQSGSSRKDILGNDIFERPSPHEGPDARPRFNGEQILTTSLINVTSGVRKKISFVTGHGEATISGFSARDVAGLNEMLVRENFDVDEINLVEQEISAETSMLAIVSPMRDFFPAETEKIRSFVRGRSGHLLVALDPLSQTPRLETFLLQEFGVLANNDVVIDPRGVQRQYWTVAPELLAHKALRPLRTANLICIMFHCRSLSVEGREGYTAVTYLETIENAYAKRNLRSGAEISLPFEEGKDARGPLKLAVALEDTRTASPSRVLIFGDSDFVANGYISFGGNRDLIINTVNWMLGQEKLIAIRPKIVSTPEIVFKEEDANHIFTLSVIVPPLLIALFGGAVFIWRRRV